MESDYPPGSDPAVLDENNRSAPGENAENLRDDDDSENPGALH